MFTSSQIWKCPQVSNQTALQRADKWKMTHLSLSSCSVWGYTPPPDHYHLSIRFPGNWARYFQAPSVGSSFQSGTSMFLYFRPSVQYKLQNRVMVLWREVSLVQHISIKYLLCGPGIPWGSEAKELNLTLYQIPEMYAKCGEQEASSHWIARLCWVISLGRVWKRRE